MNAWHLAFPILGIAFSHKHCVVRFWQIPNPGLHHHQSIDFGLDSLFTQNFGNSDVWLARHVPFYIFNLVFGAILSKIFEQTVGFALGNWRTYHFQLTIMMEHRQHFPF